jgi:quercetin dioxygenase-like cupin family protein
MKTKSCKKIQTEDKGWLLEILSDQDGFSDIKGQVYLITINPGKTKGPHSHPETDYYVSCIKGLVKYSIGNDTMIMGDDDFKIAFMPKGSSHSIENIGNDLAYVVIYRSISYKG